MCNTCGGKSYHRPNRKKALKKDKERCPENENKENKEPLRCPTRKRLLVKPKKCLTAVERIMARIQPPIADRERYLHPEHVNCFLEESERIYAKEPAHDPHLRQKPKACAEDGKYKTKRKPNYRVEDGEKDMETRDEEKGKEMDEKKDAETVEQKIEDNKNAKGNEKKLENQENAKPKIKNNKNKKKKKKDKRATKDIEDCSDSETSICSIDSEVCLVGSSLTKGDKKMIEENRRKVHPSLENEDKIAKDGNDVPTNAAEQGDDQATTEEPKNEDE